MARAKQVEEATQVGSGAIASINNIFRAIN